MPNREGVYYLPPQYLPPGTELINRYIIEQAIGRGSSSITYNMGR